MARKLELSNKLRRGMSPGQSKCEEEATKKWQTKINVGQYQIRTSQPTPRLRDTYYDVILCHLH